MNAVEARPRRSARIAWVAAAVVFLVFLVVGIVEPHASAGAHFGIEDQAFTVVIGIVLGGLCLLPVRPRLRADGRAVHLRGFVGGYRTVPWELVQRVEFPSNARFARLVLPAEELMVIYAVQRADREHAVAAMRGLRELFAATHAQQ